MSYFNIWTFYSRISIFFEFLNWKYSRKWFEPRSNIPWLKKFIWVIGALRRTVVSDWRFDNLEHIHNSSQGSNHPDDLFQSKYESIQFRRQIFKNTLLRLECTFLLFEPDLLWSSEQINHEGFMNKSSPQITFPYKPVICQARNKVWPDMEPVWSDKKRRDNNIRFRHFFWTLFFRQAVTLNRCLLNYLMNLMKTTGLLDEYWQE